MKGLTFLAVLCLLSAPLLRAQELISQPAPFTAWLDLQAGKKSPSAARVLPIWLEKTETHTQKSPSGRIEKTILRIRFRRFSGINDEMMLRLFFNGSAKPRISAWSEIGVSMAAPRELSTVADLPTADTLVFSMAGVDYIDIETPGDGSNLQGVFLSSLQKSETRNALDFNVAPPLADPFQNPPPSTPQFNDALLFGRVKATIEKGTVALTAENGGSGIFKFDLASSPLIAVVTFEIANVDIASPPEMILNGRGLGRAAILLPDLADPAYTGDAQPLDAAFHYRGWLKCQKVIPGSTLVAGTNSLQISSRSGAVAIRAIEVQLKYTTRPDAP